MRTTGCCAAMALVTLLLSACHFVTAATIPYQESFNGPGTEFMEFDDAKWSLVDGEYENSISSTVVGFRPLGFVSSASLNLTNVVGRNFVMSTQFTLDDVRTDLHPDSAAAVSLAALSSNADFFAGGAVPYVARYYVVGTIRNLTGSLLLREVGGDVEVNAQSAGTLPVKMGQPYTLSLAGEYSGGQLTLTATVSDGTSTLSVSDSDPTPQAGMFFGYHNHVFAYAGTVALNVDFDNFSMTPEPSATAMCLGAVLAILRRQSFSRQGAAD